MRELGVDLAYTLVVGDRPEDISAALDFFTRAGIDLIVTSGGLGPTEDDCTVETVANYFKVSLSHDEQLAGKIARIVGSLTRRYPQLNARAVEQANAKQATVPVGAEVLDPVGTAPGLVLGSELTGGPVTVVLPGPPGELRPMWKDALRRMALVGLLKGTAHFELGMLRLFGIPESELAETLRSIENDGFDLAQLEITTCLRRGEIEIATRYLPSQADHYQSFVAEIEARHGRQLFSKDGETIDGRVARLLVEKALSIAVGESCTGGLLSGRLTDLPGSSAYFNGGVVAYSNRAKTALLSVDPAVLELHGAVSEQVAEQLAAGARERFSADLGVGITGIAGPGGATADKPVGRCCISVVASDLAPKTVTVDIPGNRATVRDRVTAVALHAVRRTLESGFAQ